MVEKIAVVNDISSFGKCSLTVAIPVISALKVQACPLITSVLSNQTCYDSFYMRELTYDMNHIIDKWKELGFGFDGICSGFLTDKDQAEAIYKLVEEFKKDDVKFILDPIMGDDSEVYANYSEGLRLGLKKLCYKADIIMPNMTELSLLTEVDTKEFLTEDKFDDVEKITSKAIEFGKETGAVIIVTGVRTKINGTEYVNNIIVENGDVDIISTERINGHFSGTGDLMSSIVSALVVRGFEIKKAVGIAADFISRAVSETLNGKDINRNDGVNFENILNILTQI